MGIVKKAVSWYNPNDVGGYTNTAYMNPHPVGAGWGFFMFYNNLISINGGVGMEDFCEKAKKYELLLVAGDDFGCPGWVRVAYCVKTETITRALPLFNKLAKEYQK